MELSVINCGFNMGGAPIHVIGSLQVDESKAAETAKKTGAVDLDALKKSLEK